MTRTAPPSATIHLAIELSRSVWLVAARLPGVEKPSLHRIEGGDTAALLALAAALRARAAGRLGARRSRWPAASRRGGTGSGCTVC